jgi:hypothetical protein
VTRDEDSGRFRVRNIMFYLLGSSLFPRMAVNRVLVNVQQGETTFGATEPENIAPEEKLRTCQSAMMN